MTFGARLPCSRRRSLNIRSKQRFTIGHVEVERGGSTDDREIAEQIADEEGSEADTPKRGLVVLAMQVRGKRPVSHLVAALADIGGVTRVATASDDELD